MPDKIVFGCGLFIFSGDYFYSVFSAYIAIIPLSYECIQKQISCVRDCTGHHRSCLPRPISANSLRRIYMHNHVSEGPGSCNVSCGYKYK